MNLVEKVKSNIDVWKLEKYTRRRDFLPEYKSKDLDYYKEVYQDGVYCQEYSNSHNHNPTMTDKIAVAQGRFIKRASSLFSKRSFVAPKRSPPCSEAYNRKIDY